VARAAASHGPRAALTCAPCFVAPPPPPCRTQPGDDDDVEVRLEDQQHINTFGRMNGRLHDLEEDLKAKQAEHELLDDAANEIILADDDEPVRYAFGECYYEVTKDAADELLESQKDKIAEEVSKIEEELSSVRATLADLKTKLYGRFGKSINLEE